MFEFQLPDVGEGIHEGEIVNWLVDEGDTVDEDQDIVEVMTDKATVQISSPVAGRIDDLVFDEGATVEVGQVFVVIDPDDEVPSAEPAGEAEADQPAPATGESGEPEAPSGGTNGHRPRRTPHGVLAPPSVRIAARKRGIDVAAVDGSGPAGRVTMADLDDHEDEAQPDAAEPEAPTRPAGGPSPIAGLDVEPPAVDRETAREVEPVRARERSPRAVSARANRLQPHFTHAVEVRADDLVEDVERAAERADADLDLQAAFVVKALGRALTEHERCNAWVDEESRDLVVADRVNVAVATPTADGLELRTVADADERGVLPIARALADGGDADADPTFTLTSLDGIGGLVSTPLLVHPQVAGVAAGSIRDVGVLDDGIRPGRELTLAFAFDHRYVDGYDGAMLAETVRELLASPDSMLLGSPS